MSYDVECPYCGHRFGKEKEMKKFKFELGQRVFVIGLAGMVIITGRGQVDFHSGGKLNMYQVQGAHRDYRCEQELLSLEETENITVKG